MRRSRDRLPRSSAESWFECWVLSSQVFEVWPLADPPSSSFGEDASDATADPNEGAQVGDRERFDLAVPAVESFEKVLHGDDAGGDPGLGGALGLGFDGAAAEHGEGGGDLAFDALLDDGEEERPDVGGGVEEVAAVTDAVVDLDEVPVLEFLEACADVRARDGECFGDIFCGEGFGREIEERVNLGDGAIDAPTGTHLPPVQNELLGGVG